MKRHIRKKQIYVDGKHLVGSQGDVFLYTQKLKRVFYTARLEAIANGI